MICKKCGRDYTDDSKFCPYCGTPNPEQGRTNSSPAENEPHKAERVVRRGNQMRTGSEGETETQSRPPVRPLFDVQSGNPRKNEEKTGFEANADYRERTAWQYNSTFQSKSVPGDTGVMRRRGGFILADGEQVIRRYACADLITVFLIFKSKVHGYLTVTNKRMLYEAESPRSRISMEAPIDSIGGIKTTSGININIRRIIVGIILCLISFFCFYLSGQISSSYSSDSGSGVQAALIGVVFIFFGVFLLFSCFRRSYSLVVNSNKVTGVAVSIGEGIQSRFGNAAIFALAAEPTEMTEQMQRELGALVQDIQQLGDRAIQKWKT